MATAMLMFWPGLTEEQYEAVRKSVGFEEDVPQGARLHVAGFADGGLRVLDVWESQQAFERFAEERLMPAVKEVGIDSEPQVQFYEVHNLFAPAFQPA